MLNLGMFLMQLALITFFTHRKPQVLLNSKLNNLFHHFLILKAQLQDITLICEVKADSKLFCCLQQSLPIK